MAIYHVLSCGWPTGVHDCRRYHYEYPWLAVCQETGRVEGCYTREEARMLLVELKQPLEECEEEDYP